MADLEAVTLADTERLAGVPVAHIRRIGGEHGTQHFRARLADGRELFIKAAASPAAGAALTAEAAGLAWLADASAVPIPEVIFTGNGILALAWLPVANAEARAATRFGRELARMHAAGPASFGAPWPGFIASLPLANDQADSWPSWYAKHRLVPFAKMARDAGTFSPADVTLIETVAERISDLSGPAEPPSRIHGDCWTGNLLWSGGQGWLIDPAAHGGHRETDLAMLALFGAPFLAEILSAYQEQAPFADGWRQRVPLHQLHPLLVHVCLFGAGYRDAALSAARAALSA